MVIGFAKRIVFFYIVCISMLFSLTGYGFNQEFEVEELVRDEFGLEPVQMCIAYSTPITDFGREWRLNSLFQLDLQKAKKRIQLAPTQYDRIMLGSRVQSGDLTERADALKKWLNRFIATTRSLPSQKFVSEIGVASQIQHCKKKHVHFDQVIEKIKNSDDTQKHLKIEHFEKLKKKVIETECLKMTYAMADAGKRRILIGDRMLLEQKTITLKFAMLHELCHLEFPGIRGMSSEEVFCDAIAWHWIKNIVSATELSELIGTKENFGSVPEILFPPNQNMELLVMRSQLPILCRKNLLNF